MTMVSWWNIAYCSLDQRKFARMFHCSKPAAANKKIKLMNKSFMQTICNVFWLSKLWSELYTPMSVPVLVQCDVFKELLTSSSSHVSCQDKIPGTAHSLETRPWTSAANRSIGSTTGCLQSRRRPLLGPSPGWKRLLALSHLRHY